MKESNNQESNQTNYSVGTLIQLGNDGTVTPSDQYDLFHSLYVGGWVSLRTLAEQMQILFMNSGVLGDKQQPLVLGNLLFQSSEKLQNRQVLILSQRTSCILIGWAILEALANFMAEMTIAISDELEGSPERSRSITSQERDYLREEVTYFDSQKFQTRIRSNKFVPTLDKLVTVPKLLASVKGIDDFQLDCSGRGWQAIMETKRIRDMLTHPKLDDIPLNELIQKSIKVVVEGDDIVNIVNGLTWYATSLWPLLESTFAGLFIGCLQLMFIELYYTHGDDSDAIASSFGFDMNQMIGG